MPTQLLMPALSPTMEKGKLAAWLVAEGGKVMAGDVIAEIETDKATMELEAIDDGVLGRILVPEGSEDVPVNQPIAVLLADGESREALDGFVAEPVVAKTPPSSPSKLPPILKNTTVSDAPIPAVHSAATPAENMVRPGGNGAAEDQKNRLLASPLARRLAKLHDIDLGQIVGSGPHGRIVKRDVDQWLAQPQPQLKPAAAAAGVTEPFSGEDYTLHPHDGMRRIIAQRLSEAKSTIPHYYISLDCELDALLAARSDINASLAKKSGKTAVQKVSVNDFIIKALAMALQEVPQANVSWRDDAMVHYRHSDVAVAVAIPGGLVTPVIRKAETKGLSVISSEMKDFARRAYQRKLLPQEYQGGVTAVSNLGMFGVKSFSAVINPPHATILAVGAGEPRAVVREGAVVVRTIMSVTLSCDHRAIDGAVGADLLAAFKANIQNPALMLV